MLATLRDQNQNVSAQKLVKFENIFLRVDKICKDFSEVILNEIESYFSTYRPIKWVYDATSGCPANFTVQCYICDSETNSIWKTTSRYLYERLKLPQIYRFS